MKKWKWADNYIGDEGARMISEGLKSNSTLTTLDLPGEMSNDNRDKSIEMMKVK